MSIWHWSILRAFIWAAIVYFLVSIAVAAEVKPGDTYTSPKGYYLLVSCVDRKTGKTINVRVTGYKVLDNNLLVLHVPGQDYAVVLPPPQDCYGRLVKIENTP